MCQRCMSHDTTHTSVPRQRHTRELTHKGRSEVTINVGSQYLNFVSVIGGLPLTPVSRKSVVDALVSRQTYGSRRVGNMDDVENGMNRQV
jgi:hypothetical protein